MTSLLKIGLILMAVTVLLVLVHPADADDDIKRKRVIIKIPHRVKHIYHHHTKKVHVHKKKPKPKPKKKTPHKHVHVVVEEEEIVQPIKSWKTIQSPFKKGTSTGWDEWKAPSGFKQSVRHPDDFRGSYGGESTHLEEDFAFEDDHDTRESRTYGRPYNKGLGPSNSSGGGGKRVRKGGRGGMSSSYRSHEDPSFEASYEIYHQHDEDDFEGERPRRKPKSKMSSGMSAAPRPNVRGGPPSRSTYGKTTRRPRFEDKYREPDEYDELYDRGPAYPEHKEHPSWHHRSRKYAEQAVASEQNIWNLPKVPEVNEYIDDVNDTPDPGVTFQNGGGFYPSQYNPITTITSSVVQNSPPISSAVNDYPANVPFHDFPANNGFNNFKPPNGYNPGPGLPPLPQQQPIVPNPEPAQQEHRPIMNNKVIKKPKKNPGYLSQVSQTSDGLTVGYKSHVGHSSDIQSPSSSFQSVSYGIVHTKK